MVSLEPNSSPRISFSAEFLDENNFISICPKEREREKEKVVAARNADFEFLSGDKTNMIAADELFSEGKLLPFWQVQPLSKIALKSENDADDNETTTDQTTTVDDRRISWFLDDDPSPRPPKCTVLWKELLRLKKQRPSTLSPSSSSSSSSSSNSDPTTRSCEDQRKKGASSKDKVVNKVKKGLERTRSANIRIRPMINVPICTAAKNAALPPLFPRRGRLEIQNKNT